MYIIYILLLVIILSSNSVLSSEISVYKGEKVQTLVTSIEILDNTDNCLIDCYAEIKVCNKNPLLDSKINEGDFDIWFNDKNEQKITGLNEKTVYNKEKLKDFKILIEKPVMKQVVVNDYGPCKDYDPVFDKEKGINVWKEFDYDNCIIGSHYEFVEVNEYVPFSEITDSTLKKNTCYKIRIEGTKDPEESIDWKIKLFSLEPNWAWWDAGYPYRYQIYNNHTTTEYTLSVNDTGLVGGNQIIWSSLINDSYIYCEESGCSSGLIAIANETNEKNWENESSKTGNNPTEIWKDYVAVYHLTEANSIDSTLRSNGTAGGDPTVVTGLFGNGLEMDGVGDYVDIDNIVNYFGSHGSFTVEFWVKPTREWNATTGTMGLGSHAGGRADIWYNSHNGAISMLSWDGSAEHTIYYTMDFLKDTWYYVVFTFDSGTKDAKIYINGEWKVTEANYDWENHATPRGCIGGDYDGSPSSYGVYDEYKFSNTTRDLAYIQVNYYNGLGNMTTIGSEEEDEEAPEEDTTPPQWENILEQRPDPSSYDFDLTYGFSVICDDETGMTNAFFEHNISGVLTNITMSNTGNVYYANITSFPASTINYSFICNDTSGNVNRTDYNTYTVSKNADAGGLYVITGSIPDGEFEKTYEQVSSIWVATTNYKGGSDTTLRLYRNETLPASHECGGSWICDLDTILPVGAYEYMANNTEGENYTVDSVTQIVTVDQRTPTITIYNITNGTYPLNLTIYYGMDDINSLSGSIYYNGTPFTNNTNPYLGVGIWNITAYTSGNENYTSNSNTTIINSSYAVGDDLFNVTSITYNTFANETGTTYFETTVYYNKWYIDNITSILDWNGTSNTATLKSSNSTHYIFNKSINVPLLQTNNTEIEFNFNNTFHFLLNDTNIQVNDTKYKQNITYAYFIDSLDTDSANYIEGEDVDVELYVVKLLNTANLTVNFTFYYNGSYLDTENITTYTNAGALKLYESTFNSLQNTNNTETKNIIANLTIRYNGIERIMGEEETVDVYKMVINECGGITNTTTLTVSYWDELDFTARNGTLGLIIFTVTSGDVTREYAFENVSSAYNHSFCIYPTWGTLDSSIYLEYEASDTPRRPYYVVNTELTDDGEEIKAYLLNDTYAYYTNVYLYDENGATLQQHYVRILKYNPDIIASETLFIGKTDDSGIFATFLQPLEQPYSFIITDSDGDILYQTEKEVITCISGTCPPYEKHIYIDPSELDSLNLGTMEAIYSWNESTSTVDITVSDSDGLATGVWLMIDEVQDFGKKVSYINETYDTSTLAFSGVLPNTTSEYEVRVMVEEFGKWYPLITRSITMENIIAFGILGILIAFILTLSLEVGGLVLGGPVLGLIGVGGGLAISKLLNLIPLPFVGLYSVLFVVGMVIYLLVKGD